MQDVSAPNHWRNPGTKRARGVVFAFVSGSPGVGKTTLARGLSTLFARRDVPTDLKHLTAGARWRSVVAPSLHRFVNPPPRTNGPSSDCVVLDGPSGLHPALLEIARAADFLILVTTPQHAALADTYAVVKYLVQQGIETRLGLVVNQTPSELQATRTHARLSQATLRFLGRTVAYLGHVPPDEQLRLIAHRELPPAQPAPQSAASACLEAICEHLAPTCPPRRPPAWLWSRIASIFL
jgi:MinD-like ATPase involved in chromosome partitioning or flagellar assembly